MGKAVLNIYEIFCQAQRVCTPTSFEDGLQYDQEVLTIFIYRVFNASKVIVWTVQAAQWIYVIVHLMVRRQNKTC